VQAGRDGPRGPWATPRRVRWFKVRDVQWMLAVALLVGGVGWSLARMAVGLDMIRDARLSRIHTRTPGVVEVADRSATRSAVHVQLVVRLEDGSTWRGSMREGGLGGSKAPVVGESVEIVTSGQGGSRSLYRLEEDSGSGGLWLFAGLAGGLGMLFFVGVLVLWHEARSLKHGEAFWVFVSKDQWQAGGGHTQTVGPWTLKVPGPGAGRKRWVAAGRRTEGGVWLLVLAWQGRLRPWDPGALGELPGRIRWDPVS